MALTSEQIVQVVFENLQLPPFLLLDTNLHIQGFNRAAQQLVSHSFGRPALKSGSSIYNYLPGPSLLTNWPSLLEQIVATGSRRQLELELDLAGGGRRWFIFQCVPFSYANSQDEQPAQTGIAMTIYATHSSAPAELNHLEIGTASSSWAVKPETILPRQWLGATPKSEMSFARFVRSVPLPLALTTLRDGRYVEVSESFAAATGYSREKLIGSSSLLVWSSPQTQEVFLQTLQAQGHVRNFEAKFRDCQGQLRQCLASGELIKIDGEDCLLTMLVDITERKQIEAELVRKEQELAKRVLERTMELTNLLQVSQDVAAVLEMKPLAALLLEQLKRMVGYSNAALFTCLGAEPKSSLNFQLLEKKLEPAAEKLFERLANPDFMDGIAEITKNGQVFIVADALGKTGAAGKLRVLLEKTGSKLVSSARSWLVASLLVKKQPVGVLILTSTQPNYYTNYHTRLTSAIAGQAAVALEKAWLYEQASKAAVLEERQRLARDLHDSVSQILYGILLGTQAAQRELEQDKEGRNKQFSEQLQYIFSLAQGGLEEMRALLFELRPEALVEEGLVAALQKQAASLRVRYQLKIDCRFSEEPAIPFKVKEGLYRVAQEGLHNIVKHARASQVEIYLGWVGKPAPSMPARLRLEIKDNGRGFDVASTFPGHLGLRSMRERLKELGGVLEIESTPGQGTTLRATVPLPLPPV